MLKKSGVSLFLTDLVGSDQEFLLEARLFNTISLLSGLANIFGLVALLHLDMFFYLFLLQATTGIFFLVCYYLSRYKGLSEKMRWPFIVVVAIFLFLSALQNNGTMGGTHYYIFPALVIALILSPTLRSQVFSFLLFSGVALGIICVTVLKPDWITPHSSPTEMLVDVSANILFIEFFIGAVVVILMRNLNRERSRSDRLLTNILPQSVATELKYQERVHPQEYEATILFTDFVGFTESAEKMSPQQLVSCLDIYFSLFDQIIRRHGLEKIKTIGDSYMAVGGVPVKNLTHPQDCVAAALDIREAMRHQIKDLLGPDMPLWRIRIGVHTGRLVAGVIGREKFAYDVWGDSVNIASRLESGALENTVNISQSTYERIQDSYQCEFRGRIAAKNKGEISMYTVLGQKG